MGPSTRVCSSSFQAKLDDLALSPLPLEGGIVNLDETISGRIREAYLMQQSSLNSFQQLESARALA